MEFLILHLELKDYLTFLGILLTFLVSVVSLIYGFMNSRKTTFVNTVTAERIEYIQRLRNAVSEFCGLIFLYYGTELPEEEKLTTRKSYDALKYLIELHLNIEDRYFDKKIIRLIQEMREIKEGTQLGEVEILIHKLTLLMQFLLKFEWEGIKRESKKGILTQKQRDKLYDEYSEKHAKRAKQEALEYQD